MTKEQSDYHRLENETKGEGSQGEPNEWAGGTPSPAQQIPWSEIFKHHISLIEGHLRMTNMIKRHTIEGTGNWRTICQIIDRTQEMLHAAKEQSSNLIPPYDTRKILPLGSSLLSTPSGRSLEDDRLGKTAKAHGQASSSAKSQRIRINPRKSRHEIDEVKATKQNPFGNLGTAIRSENKGRTGSGSGSDSGESTEKDLKRDSTNNQSQEEDTSEHSDGELMEDGNPAFFVDINPTPVDLPTMKVKLPKRDASLLDHNEVKKHKKLKKKHSGHLPGTIGYEGIEFEDISQEVDARLKEKEERRKHKEGKKKRKRESEESVVVEAADEESGSTQLDISKKKKSKKTKSSTQTLSYVPDIPSTKPKKRQGTGDEQDIGEGKKKKRKRNVMQ